LPCRPHGDGPDSLPVALLTRSHYHGDVVEVRTKMGRRVVCTPDPPFVTQRGRVLAEDLTFEHRLPIAQGVPASEAYATTPHLSAGGLALVVGREAPSRHRGVGPKLERASEGGVHRLRDL